MPVPSWSTAKARRSCLTPLKQVAGTEVLTIEGLAKDGQLHPLQQAFIDHGAFQCGYCTSGMLLDAYALLHDDPRPSRDKIVSQYGTQSLPLRRPSADREGDRGRCRKGRERAMTAAVQYQPARLPRARSAAASSFYSGSTLSAPSAAAERPGYPSDVNAYLAIGGNGRVTVFSSKIEMGQGVMTSLAQMAAEELGVDLASIDMVMGDTEKCPWDAGTFGSLSTRMFGPALRAAAAKARAVLTALAAAKLGVAADRVIDRARHRIGRRRTEPAGELRRIGRWRKDCRDGEPDGGAAVCGRLRRDGALAQAAGRHREGHRIGQIRRRHPASRICFMRAFCARRFTARS